MKAGPQLALAIGAGYLLGRKRRLRWALVLVAASATGRMGGVPGALLSQVKAIGSGSELGEITNTVRGPLFNAGKAAMLAAVGDRLEGLTDNLQERAESLSVPSPRKPEGEQEDDGGRKRSKRDERDERDEPEEDVLEDEELDEEEPEGAEPEEEDEEYPEEHVAEEEEAPRRRRASSSRSPVRRGGRR